MPLPPGCRLGSYEILSALGAGGMGEVYRAHDARLGRDVAIKVLPEKFGQDRERLRRFEQETRALAAMSHPNILAIHDVGSREGSPYFVMELLEGETLRDRLATGALPVRGAVELTLQIAHGLAAAHAKGLIHRDLKPANLFLTLAGHLKILDFGLAKQALSAASDLSQMPTREAGGLTSEGLALGTPGYMSPEQVEGKPADARSDLFAVGVVLYEMLSGRRAFERNSTIETLSATLKEDPPELASPVGTIPALLQHLVGRCLEKEPGRRYQSAQDLVCDLESVLAELASSAGRGAGIRLRGRAMKAAGRRLWAGVAAGLAAVGLVAGLWAMRLKPTSAITSLAVLPLVNYSGDVSQDFFADGMTDWLIADLGQIKALKVISRTSVTQYKGAKKSLPDIARELGVQGILEGSVQRAGNTVRVTTRLIDAVHDRQLWSSTYERDMTDILSLQREVVREIAAQIRVQVTTQEQGRLTVARTVDPMVFDTVLKARALLEYAITEQDIRRAMAMFRAAADRSPDFAPAWAGLAESTWQLAVGGFEYVAPEEVRDKAIAAAERALALDPDLPEAHNARATIALDGDWDLEKAKYHFEKALEIRPGFANCRNTYGQLLLWGFQRYAEARKQFEKARESDPFSPWNALNSLWWYTEQGQHEQALAEGARLRRESPSNWLIPSQMSCSLTALHRYQEAAQIIEEGIESAGERSPFLLSALGQAYGLAGQRKNAERILAELEQLSHKRFVSPQYPAMVLFGLGRNDEAYQLMEKAFRLRSTALVMLAGTCEHQLGFRQDARFTAYRERIRQAIRMPKGSIAGVGP